MTTTLDVDSVIERLLSVRGQPNNRTVQLAEGEIRALCAAARCVRDIDATRDRAWRISRARDRRRWTRARRGFGAREAWNACQTCRVRVWSRAGARARARADAGAWNAFA